MPALEQVRAGLRAGKHAAGYLAYEAGHAFDPKLRASARQGDGPLLCFGLFDGYETPDLATPAAVARWRLCRPAAAAHQPRPTMRRRSSEVREHLFAGDFYQANLTFGCDVAVAGDPLALYARLRRSAQAGWGGVLIHDDGVHRLALARAILHDPRRHHRGPADEGHRAAARRSGTPIEPRPRRSAADEKQRAENLMIVDLMRNDLARVSVAGSVEVPELFAVETYPTRSPAGQPDHRSRLRAECDAIDVLRTIFPCGSVTGAPKIAAIEALAELEPEPRGAYTGSMGWIEPGGDAAFNVLIRTLEWRGGATKARLGLGSGLVVDSVPSDEWAECLLKGDFVRREAQDFDLIETMGFDPSPRASSSWSATSTG